MNRSRDSRTAYSAERRAALVGEFRSSGETQKRFAGRHGIKWTTFRNWLYARSPAKPRGTSAVAFQEVRLAPLSSASLWAAEISLAGGTVVRLQAAADPHWVQAIIQPLRQPC
jgi:transposase-like protein